METFPYGIYFLYRISYRKPWRTSERFSAVGNFVFRYRFQYGFRNGLVAKSCPGTPIGIRYGKSTKSCTQTVDSCKCVMLLVSYPEFCSVQKSIMPRITQELIEVDKKIKLDRNRATCLICGKTFVSSSFLKSARRHVRKHGLLQSRHPTNRSRSVSPEPVIRQSSPPGTCNRAQHSCRIYIPIKYFCDRVSFWQYRGCRRCR